MGYVAKKEGCFATSYKVGSIIEWGVREVYMRVKKFNPLARAIAVISVVAVSLTGVTYAALQSTATLSANTISVADSNLLIWDASAAAFEEEAPGFTIENLIPGQGSEENKFYLKNDSDGPLYVYAHVPETPAEPEGGYGFSGWQNLIVTFKSYEPGCVDNMVATNMADLLAGNVALPCNTFSQNAQGDSGNIATEGNYSVTFDINPSAHIDGADDAGVGAFDIDFIGSLIEAE